jgi:hypothetical protein
MIRTNEKLKYYEPILIKKERNESEIKKQKLAKKAVRRCLLKIEEICVISLKEMTNAALTFVDKMSPTSEVIDLS